MLKLITRKTFLWQSANLIGLALLSLMSCNSPNNRSIKPQLKANIKTMKLESDAFSNNSIIPPKYTCDRQDFSPPLKWDAPPPETQSLALIVDDPDAPMGTFVHWVLYDLPPEITHLPEAVPNDATLADGGTQGKNDFGKLGYGGPCPPSGTHRYFFKLYAIDRVLGLPSGATKEQLEAAMNGHILAAAEIIGRYARQR